MALFFNKKNTECKKCFLPSQVPDARLDQEGICHSCREIEKGIPPLHQHSEEEKAKLREELEGLLKNTKGKGAYDCIVALSGGKDSTHLLYKVKKDYPHLRILALTYGMCFMQKVAKENITTVIQKLDVDHIMLTPKFSLQKKFYKYLLENRHPRGYVTGLFEKELADKDKGLCAFCSQSVQGSLFQYAFEQQIPLILVGLAPAQPVSLFFERNAREDCTPSFMNHPPFTAEDRAYLWNGSIYPAEQELPRMIFPYHVWPYDTGVIRDTIVKEGLLDFKKSSPISSNCLLNLVMTHIDYNIDGFFNLLPQMSYMFRHGFLSLKEVKEWKKTARIVSLFCPRLTHPDIREVEKMLDINVDEIIKKYRRG